LMNGSALSARARIRKACSLRYSSFICSNIALNGPVAFSKEN
jgi:hypothetical protein